MSEIELEDVERVLKEADGALALHEILEAVCDEDDLYCHECGHPLEGTQELRDAVSAHVSDLLGNGSVASTVDWEYRWVR